MPLLIGTDEAGYGPNLGPLVVTATTWILPDDFHPNQMWNALADVLTDQPVRSDHRLHLADSKKVYAGGRTMSRLERTVQAFLRTIYDQCDTLAELGLKLSGSRFRKDYDAMCGGIVPEISLPAAVVKGRLDADEVSLRTSLGRTAIRLHRVESRIIFPSEFNDGVRKYDSKGKVLSEATLQLVRSGIESCDSPRQGWVFCDKHGGRNRYDDVISETLENAFVFRLEESRAQSRYRVDDLEFCFRTKAEELMPVALASMVSKYLREVTMMQFNRFWQHHIPGLKPTKGYPVDAKRFWAEIQAKSEELGLPKDTLWRCR